MRHLNGFCLHNGHVQLMAVDLLNVLESIDSFNPSKQNVIKANIFFL